MIFLKYPFEKPSLKQGLLKEMLMELNSDYAARSLKGSKKLFMRGDNNEVLYEHDNFLSYSQKLIMKVLVGVNYLCYGMSGTIFLEIFYF